MRVQDAVMKVNGVQMTIHKFSVFMYSFDPKDGNKFQGSIEFVKDSSILKHEFEGPTLDAVIDEMKQHLISVATYTI